MMIEFIVKNKVTKSIGPFKDVRIRDVALVADGEKIAYFNRDESYWSEDWSYDTLIHEIVIK